MYVQPAVDVKVHCKHCNNINIVSLSRVVRPLPRTLEAVPPVLHVPVYRPAMLKVDNTRN